ncbi:MAG: PfkB family carbohydrate kinase [Chloroflexota bacterium]|nr:PfkB family carbohydrate kinase [Chloroflexota bacterium]MDE2919918.1 PfkB family carbohydrate kinase [Chloroflexota bacterium]
MTTSDKPGRVVVIGTVGIDDIETAHESVQGVLGGSATYAALASRHFAPTTMSSVVGHDFPTAHRELLSERDIDLSSLETADGLTFRWGGRYAENMNVRETTFVDLNVLENFDPRVPAHAKAESFVFLGNTDPSIQLRILEQVVDPRFVVVDSMDLWIEGDRQQVSRVFARCDCVVLNDEEARLFGGHANIPRAVRTILDLGPTYVVVKRGEFGAALVSDHGWFFAPAYPLDDVVDPTGAGDSFAGAFLGSLAAAGSTDEAALRRAVIYGSVAASFTVEAFSVDRLAELTRHDIDSRYVEFGDFAAF